MARSVRGEIIDGRREARFRQVEARIARVTHLLDDLVPVPGTGQRVGMDPVIGLIPVVGDVVAATVGGWVILEAARFGVPRIALARMVVNLVVDLLVGAVPLLGDLFDIVTRSNSANLAIFRKHALDPAASTRGDRWFFVGLALVLAGLVWAVMWLAARLIEAVGALLA